ncbi:MAG: type II toxin-antitoxin system VapC family toxin [Brevundimonas sp.]|uniref:type II toxin-antitoxin system VapC family toxin n=1 Tax=Brevundimonas sp. TaxID=1871086 RepID=UPI0025C44C1C|nr:VapC toxin family PIN domain ribonuclease [Brevundimonas sp.]MBX3477696.1 type II toxin-antitoxin system VapC family toxin [Brevundimonas sp.]
MILADTSIWAGHLRTTDPIMEQLLDDQQILMHPFVIGELAMGNLADRSAFLRSLDRMKSAPKALDKEVLKMIEQGRHFGAGMGWIDAHLLASVLLTDHARLWTRDRRLNTAAAKHGRSASLHH